MNFHEPVLKEEVLKYLEPAKGKVFIDATLGDGGHSLELLKAGSKVLGVDCYQGSLDRATHRFGEAGLNKNFTGILGNFRNIENIAKKEGFNQVNGILFDLGFSSSELDENLGLSFTQDQPLDMRLDSSLGVTAKDILNTFSESDLAKIFFKYANEKLAKKFAKAIVESRNLQKLQTTKQLAELLLSVAPPGYERGRIHPATRVFQALRIVVNDEIENLKTALPQAARLLLPGGRMAIISFHSLEDKVAKDFGHAVQPALEERTLQEKREDSQQESLEEKPLYLREVTKKPIFPSEKEVCQNVRSRSAKLRVFEKI